jgi:predicted permease
MRLLTIFHRRQLEKDLQDEIVFHLSKRGDTRRFGNKTKWQEEMRDLWTFPWLEALMQDLRHAGRMLRRSPSFTAVAILSLALGIGGTTAIFSLMEPLLLRKLPVQAPDELAVLGNHDHSTYSYQAYEAFRNSSPPYITGILATSFMGTTVQTREGRPESVRVELVTGSYFPVLGVNAALGRTLTRDDDRVPGGHPLVVLNASYWERRFHRDSEIIGKPIIVNGTPFTIAGVADLAFSGLDRDSPTQLWIPAAMHREVLPGRDWWARRPGGEQADLEIFVRLRAGTTLQTAHSALSAAFLRQQTELHGSVNANRKLRERPFEVLPASRGVSSARRTYTLPLQVLMIVTALVLLIAATNLATLLLAHAGARRREFVLRLSLGASRGRLIQQLLTEAALLSVCGAALGLLIANWGVRVLLRMAATHTLAPAVNWRVIGFTVLVTVITTLLFGLWPALRGTQMDRSASDGRRSGGVVVLAEVSLSIVLLFCAAIFLHSLRNLRQVDLGLQPERLIRFEVGGVSAESQTAAFRRLCRDLPGRIAAVPGVSGVTLSGNGLFGGWSKSTSFDVLSAGEKPEDNKANFDVVGAGFFSTLGSRLLAGRDFDPRDSETGTKVVIVNETISRTYFPGANPVGRKARIHGEDREIIGVARDIRDYRVRQAPKPFFYLPILQAKGMEMFGVTKVPFLLRTVAEPESVMRLIRATIRSEQGSLTVENMNSIPVLIDRQLSIEGAIAQLSAYFALLGALLVAMGIHGVLTHRIVQRTREIGIRIALGALPGQVAWTVTREGTGFLIAGLLTGLAAAYAVSRFVAALLFEVQPLDILSMLAAVLSLLLTVVPAALFPAFRAARLDPALTLRQD